MIHKVTVWNHVAVVVAILAMTLLTATRVIGGGDDARFRPESFDSKQVTVQPVGDGVRIREVVDIDFGATKRRGYQRIVPNDFGVPEEIVASSPDAIADINVVQIGGETRIRLGDPDVTFTGRHRYVLEYTLPDAMLNTGVLALDVIGNAETFETARFEVVMTGFDFTATDCDTGAFGSFGGCTLTEQANGNWVTVIEPLAAGEGITVGGVIAGFTDVVPPKEPAVPARAPDGLSSLAIVVAVLGLATALGVYRWSRWYGSNEIVGGGAADAAYGDLPIPQSGEPIADVPTYRVPDSRLAEMATIEFAPPRGLEPWQGTLLLNERIGNETVSAWFSEMIAREAIVVDEDESGDLTLSRGDREARLNAVDHGHLDRLFAGGPVELGKYDKGFTSTWSAIQREQDRFAGQAGWWNRGPGAGGFDPRSLGGLLGIGFFLVIFGGNLLAGVLPNLLTLLAASWLAIVLAIVVPGIVALIAYRRLLPARTATGSALTLRTESFRRFLDASEGRHVDWAWEHGLVREYSAWAVALDAADAWKRAVESSNIPDRSVVLNGPLLIATNHGVLRSTYTPPSSSSSGGGFSGGVGGGGGGGSSGSW